MTFFQFCTSVFFFFFDHADCGTCFLLAKNGIVIHVVTRHSASESSDENAHAEVQHLPSAAFLDRFLRSRPGQLPKLKETFLSGHSILQDRLLKRKRKKMTSRRYRHAPCQRDFLTSYSSATRHEWLNLFSSRHECFTSDSGLTRTRLVSCAFLTSLLLSGFARGQALGCHAVARADRMQKSMQKHCRDTENDQSVVLNRRLPVSTFSPNHWS